MHAFHKLLLCTLAAGSILAACSRGADEPGKSAETFPEHVAPAPSAELPTAASGAAISGTSLQRAQELLRIVRRADALRGPDVLGKQEALRGLESKSLTDAAWDGLRLPHEEAQLALDALNALRAYNGLEPVKLTGDASMQADAQMGALSMALQNRIDHGLKGFAWQPAGGVKATNRGVLSYANVSQSSEEGAAVVAANHPLGLVGDEGVASLGHRIQLLEPQLATTAIGIASNTHAGQGTGIQTVRHYVNGELVKTEEREIPHTIGNTAAVMVTLKGSVGDAEGDAPYDAILNSAAHHPPAITWPPAGYVPYALLMREKNGETRPWLDLWSFAVLDPAATESTV